MPYVISLDFGVDLKMCFFFVSRVVLVQILPEPGSELLVNIKIMHMLLNSRVTRVNEAIIKLQVFCL